MAALVRCEGIVAFSVRPKLAFGRGAFRHGLMGVARTFKAMTGNDVREPMLGLVANLANLLCSESPRINPNLSAVRVELTAETRKLVH